MVLFATKGLIYNLISLASLFVGFLIFRVQGVICNVKDRLIDEARNRELDRIDRETFGVSEEETDESQSTEADSNEESEEVVNNEIIEEESEEKRDE